jgi:hypothetical protein
VAIAFQARHADISSCSRTSPVPGSIRLRSLSSPSKVPGDSGYEAVGFGCEESPRSRDRSDGSCGPDSKHPAGFRIELPDTILGDLKQVPAVEGRSSVRGDIDRAERLAARRIEGVQLVSGGKPKYPARWPPFSTWDLARSHTAAYFHAARPQPLIAHRACENTRQKEVSRLSDASHWHALAGQQTAHAKPVSTTLRSIGEQLRLEFYSQLDPGAARRAGREKRHTLRRGVAGLGPGGVGRKWKGLESALRGQ